MRHSDDVTGSNDQSVPAHLDRRSCVIKHFQPAILRESDCGSLSPLMLLRTFSHPPCESSDLGEGWSEPEVVVVGLSGVGLKVGSHASI